MRPWGSLVVGDEDYIGPSGKLLCLRQTPKNYAAHAWHDSKQSFNVTSITSSRSKMFYCITFSTLNYPKLGR